MTPRRYLRTSVADGIAAELTAAGCDGWTWAQATGMPETGHGVRGDDIVPTASMYKMHLLGAACLAADAGDLALSRRVTVDPGKDAGGSRGSVGFGQFSDPVELSLRDLLRQMVTVSDNVAAHMVAGLLPDGAVERFIGGTGLTRTRIAPVSAGEPAAPTGARAGADAVRHVAGRPAARQDPPASYSTSTARELCAVLDWFWTRPDAPTSALAREILGQQAWHHRIPSGFPATGVRFHGKTGTIGAFRGETAVVTVDGEPPVTVTVMTRSARPGGNLPTVDTVIGRIARLLVDDIRRSL